MPAVGGDGQERILRATVLLHGDAPLCALYLAAAGVGRLLFTGEVPELAARDETFATGRGGEADWIVDLGDGRFRERAAVFGEAKGNRIAIGGELEGREPPTAAARALLEALAAAETLLRICGGPARRYHFTLP